MGFTKLWTLEYFSTVSFCTKTLFQKLLGLKWKYDNKYLKFVRCCYSGFFCDILSLNVKMYVWLKLYTVPFFVSGQTYKISKGSNNYCSHCMCTINASCEECKLPPASAGWPLASFLGMSQHKTKKEYKYTMQEGFSFGDIAKRVPRCFHMILYCFSEKLFRYCFSKFEKIC